MSTDAVSRADRAERSDARVARSRVIALGASAGGIEALTRIVRDLPPTFGAPILVVVHTPPTAMSRLPEVLGRAGPLPAGHAQQGEIPRPGRVYIAPPDRHMVVTEGRLVLIEGPHENGVRPAVDPLFRSVGAWYRHRALGGVLSGTLDDGTAGIATIHAKGGVTVAQEPGDAIAPGMPTSAIENVGVDFVLPAGAMAPLFTRFATGATPRPDNPDPGFGAVDRSSAIGSPATSEPSDLVCPECGGVLRHFRENGLIRFHCRVGHTYSPDALYSAQ